MYVRYYISLENKFYFSERFLCRVTNQQIRNREYRVFSISKNREAFCLWTKAIIVNYLF